MTRLFPQRRGLQPFLLAGAHDGLSSRLVEEAGFDGVWASGLEITASHCVPDRSILPRDEFLDRLREMAQAVTIPIIADVDAGFGDARETARTARGFADAGACAIVIEDQKHPKINSFADSGHVLESIPGFCEKIQSARAACSRLIVVARVESLVVGETVEMAVRRATAYAAAGAHGVIFHGKSKNGLDVVAALNAWGEHSPAGVIPTTYFSVTRDALSRAGASFIIYANHGIRAATQAMQGALRQIIIDGNTASIEESIAPLKEIFRLQESALQQQHGPTHPRAELDHLLRQNSK